MNWDTQRQVWDHVFNEVLKIRPLEHHAVVTEPVFNFPSVQDTMNEMLFEEYKFKSVLRTSAPAFSAFNYAASNPKALCTLVVDTGYSFTHIVPFYRQKFIPKAILRIDVGGKLLTNHLKEVTSYRQLNVMDETYVMNQVKEDVCFVSRDFDEDMQVARKRGPENTLIKEYVLPDFSSRRRGFIKEQTTKLSGQSQAEEQCLRLSNERFSIPEILFNPSDIGINQMGIADAIQHSISQTPAEMHPHLYDNIVVTGGSAMFQGFYERLELEVRKLAPAEFNVSICMPSNAVSYAWQGGKLLSKSGRKRKQLAPVTLEEYREYGHSVCHRAFSENVWNEY